MNEVLISIIVPVHNAGNYLYKCLDSIVNQTLRNIEIIIVLDCPTDGSDKVVEEYAKKDSRIVVVKNKTNLHIGKSRNEGLKVAKGKYISFCDHDDYMDECLCERMSKLMESGDDIDIVVSPYIEMVGERRTIYHVYPKMDKEKMPASLFLTAIGITGTKDPLRDFSLIGTVWNKMFRRSIIVDNHISFLDTRIYTYEDVLFLIAYFSHCKNGLVCEKDLYYHIMGINNTSLNYSYVDYRKLIPTLHYMYDYHVANNMLYDKCDLHDRFYNTVRCYLLRMLYYELHFNGVSEFMRVIKDLKKEALVRSAFERDCGIITPTGKQYKKIIKKIYMYILYILICKL